MEAWGRFNRLRAEDIHRVRELGASRIRGRGVYGLAVALKRDKNNPEKGKHS